MSKFFEESNKSSLGFTLIIENNYWKNLVKKANSNLKNNKKCQTAYFVSQVLLGAMSAEAFEINTGFKLDNALADADIVQFADTLAESLENQERAERIKLKQAQSVSLEAINRTLNNMDSSPTQVVACNEALIKIQTAMDSDSFYLPKLSRNIQIFFTTVQVTTPVSSFSTRIRSTEDIDSIIDAMCCINENQIKIVVDSLKESAAAKFISGGVTLGW